ncbi:MAG: alcohol acetyltransferase [Clostridia bacterium]|nr:alcohol acetyltransferase [Clostridia bacterium]
MKIYSNEKKGFWLKLDNAAKIFPGQNSKTWSNSFRVCYELTEKVDPIILKQALTSIMPRFSCYDVQIRHGFFWFYLEKNENTPDVLPDIKNPCHRIKFNENGRFLFKVYYHGNRIAIDVYHVLTDGHGGALFLSTLVAQYLRLKGAKIPTGGFVLPIDTENTSAELEDSFVKNATSKAKYKRADKFVYHAKGTKMPSHTVNITSGIIPFDKLHELSKSKGVTVTEFLAAVMLQVLCKKQLREVKKQKEVSIQIPIDLRRTYNSETLRNFTICLRVKVDPNRGEYSFDELLEQVKYQLRLQKNEKELNMMITANMGIERNLFVRALPLFIKNLGVGISFAVTAEQTTSSLITNLGAVDIPEEMRKYIDKFIFMPAPGKVNAARCGVATVNNNLCITFANVYKESDVERDFFTAFVKMGLHVKIESNRE